MANVQINLQKIKETFSDEQKMDAYISSEADKDFSLPRYMKSSFEVKLIKGVKVLLCGEGHEDIIYIPGGGFVSHPSSYQLQFALDMAKKTKKKVHTLIYPKIPKHNYQEIQKKVGQVLTFLDKPGQKMSIVSDSAGSAITLACLDQVNVSLKKLVFLSPNVDLRYNSDEQRKLEKEDEMLAYPGVEMLANLYKGEDPLDHQYVSPILLEHLPNVKTLIVVGKKEMMLHDARLLKSKYEDLSIEYKYYEVKDMMHDFVFYPIDTAKHYKDIVFDYLQK